MRGRDAESYKNTAVVGDVAGSPWWEPADQEPEDPLTLPQLLGVNADLWQELGKELADRPGCLLVKKIESHLTADRLVQLGNPYPPLWVTLNALADLMKTGLVIDIRFVKLH